MSKELADPDLERSAIASVLDDPDKVGDLIESVNLDYFTDKLARESYKWIRNRYVDTGTISKVKIMTETDIDIQELVDGNLILKDFEDILDTIEKYYIRRKLADAAREVFKVTQEDGLDIEEYQSRAEEIIFEVAGNQQLDEGIYHISDSLQKLYEDILAEQNGEEVFKGIPTGYPSIDNAISGLHDGHLCTIAGQTSMGKTAFAISLIYNMLKKGHKVIFISLEMNHDEISERLSILDSKVPASDYHKKLQGYQMKNIEVSIENLKDKNMYISDKRGLTPADIKARCRRITNNMEGVDLVVVDYLQNINLEIKENSVKALGDATLALRNLAGELSCPIVLLSQVSRNCDGIPSLQHLRGSGHIEENSDEVWFPYREHYQDEEYEGKEEAKLVMAKGRTTGSNVIDFYWYPSILYWRDGYIEKREGSLNINK